MRNFWITVSHTAVRRITSKSFIISTAVMAFLVMAFFIIPALLQTTASDEGTTVFIADTSEWDGAAAARFHELQEMETEIAGSAEEAERRAEEANGAALIITGDTEELQGELLVEGDEAMLVEQTGDILDRVQASLYAERVLELDETEAGPLFGGVEVSQSLIAGAEERPQAFSGSYWMVYGLVFIIYLIVVSFGSMIATEVAAEKSSRVMELIVSSVSPVTQMFGKLAGIGIAGLVNLAAIAAAAAAGAWLSGEETITFILDEVLDYSLLGYALLFIVLGYVLYGGLAAMTGALVSRAEEANQAMQPIIFLAMIAFFISIVALNAPELPVFRILSYVPFFTPQLLFLRIGMETVPAWEIALIIVILIASAILVNLAAARVYKGGVLMYGKFSFRQSIGRAIAVSKKES
ncbi:ABC transporter permease [Alkalicoccus luteus]|uniref:ABC transporter permease n=1 Tax=Alkalicoccus luteus TaxID=1237094 RepID=A0A969PP46_9BACI|nr:ABC transporter permease [Alkalicoccus luteus]NJP37796.1 ABC transporter permease [Alkalicoccus luteus]